MSLPGAGVEIAGRLVGEHQRRLAGERARDRHALHLAARELGRLVLHPVGEADLLEQLLDPLLALARARALEQQRHLDVLVGGDLRQQVEALEDEADLAVADVGQLVDVELGDLLAVAAGTSRSDGVSRQPTMLSSVDLPEPEGPTMATNSFGCDDEIDARSASTWIAPVS